MRPSGRRASCPPRIAGVRPRHRRARMPGATGIGRILAACWDLFEDTKRLNEGGGAGKTWTDLVEAVAALGGFLAREVAQAIVFGLGVATLRVIERWSVVVSIDVAILLHIHAEIVQALEVGGR